MAAAAMGSIHVLHVDDEPDFSDLAAKFIERQEDRMTVETAPSVSEGLDRLRHAEFDCVVSDYDMPGQNGIEFLETVRDKYPNLPFILYTGKGSEEVASEAITAGVTDYIQKESGTSQYDVLANRIVNSVERHHAQAQLRDREQRLNLFFEQSPIGVIRWDDEFNFARLNDRAREIFGYSAGELEGQPWQLVVPEENLEEIEDIVVSDLLANEGGYHSINENVRKDGERIVCEWHNWVVTDDVDEVVAVYSQFQDITDRKEREQELSELAQYNQEIVENAPVGLFRLDDQMRITYENQRAEEIVGVPEGEDESPALGKDLRALPSVQETDAIEALNRLEAGESVAFDTEFESIFGKESYLSGKGIPLFDDGKFDGAIIMVADITERKEREQILEQLRKSITEVVWVTSPEKDSMDFISDSYEDIMGLSTESLREDPLSFVDAIHPEDRARVRSALEDQQQHPEDYEEIYRIIRPDGEQRWVHDRSSGVYEDDELVRVVGVASDITERKEREQELREEQHFVDTALDTLADIFYVVSPDGEFLRWNDVFPKVTGYSDAEIAEMHPLDFFEEDDIDIVQAFIEEVLETGDASLEADLVTKDGTAIPYASKGRRIVDTEGELVGIAGISRDITERKERERELQRERDRLDEFASVVSHDLRNPLRVAEGNLELAIEEGDLEVLDDVSEAIDRMDTLIEDLLTLANSGKTVGETERIELATLAETSWRNVETASAALYIDAESSIRADESRLQQLLENLFRNAVEHGGEDVAVTVGDLPDGFYVEDDGSGIPPEERDNVLDAGYSTQEDGTGFGLNIVREVAEAHGWNISVTEGGDGGARFEFSVVETG